jgi:hypothetical protein
MQKNCATALKIRLKIQKKTYVDVAAFGLSFPLRFPFFNQFSIPRYAYLMFQYAFQPLIIFSQTSRTLEYIVFFMRAWKESPLLTGKSPRPLTVTILRGCSLLQRLFPCIEQSLIRKNAQLLQRGSRAAKCNMGVPANLFGERRRFDSHNQFSLEALNVFPMPSQKRHKKGAGSTEGAKQKPSDGFFHLVSM